VPADTHPDDDLLTYAAYRTLTGASRAVDLCRRGGRRVPNWCIRTLDVEPSVSDPALDPASSLLAVLTAGLTPIECRTWLRILNQQSIKAIAAEEGVSRTAIYVRIRGTGRTPGGMVAKNPWVAEWWHARQQDPDP